MDVLGDVKVQCFGCQSILVIPAGTLKNREPLNCRFCGEDLRPLHDDQQCRFCRGAGFALVSDVIWICMGTE